MDLRGQINNILLEERNRKLNESFNDLKDINDVDFLSNKITNITLDLMNENYSIEEIEKSFIIFEQNNSWDFKNMDLSGVFKNSMLSGVKEYIINFILVKVFGANKNFAATASVVFADFNPIDLLKIFKNEQVCYPSMTKLSDSLMEAIVRYIGGKITGTDRTDYDLNVKGIVSTGFGNIFGEIIRDSNIGESIASKFCKMIHNEKK